jgi:Carboxypeptidase regulatory-like domain/TonB dependent receptor
MNGKRGFAVSAFLALVLSAYSSTAWAQFTSAIEGTVLDPSGLVVPGATVTLVNMQTGVTQTAQTTVAGYYKFPALPAGNFSVKVELQGFKTVTQENIRLAVAEVRTVNVKMEVGATSENVTVVASVPLVETAEGRVSGLVNESQVKDLPLIGRNFYNLVVLTPGVSGRAAGGSQAYAQSNADIFINEYGVAMNANGARTESNNFLVDSSTISSSQRSGVVNITPNAEVVEEVRIAVNNFSSEFGRNGSALVNIITKTGTNVFHGSGSYFYTNNSLQTKNQFEEQTPGFEIPDFSRKEGSWGIGGPIRKDHTFFFTSGDILRSQVAITRTASILTNDFINFMKANRPNSTSTYVIGNFPASFTADRNFRTAGQLLGSSCSGSQPISSPVGSIPCDLRVTGQGTFSTTSPRPGEQYTARVDHHFNGSKDRIYGSFNHTNVDKVLFGTPDVYPAFNTISPTNSMHFNSNWTRIMSSNKLNEASFSMVHVYGNLPLNRPDIPGIQVTGIERYQTTWGPNDFAQNNFEWRDVLTWTRGSQGLKAGGSFTREHADNEGSRVFNRPIYTFNTVFDFAADSPARQDNLAIDPVTGGAVTSLLRQHRTHSLSLFVQDDWKARPNLTLTGGLRYDHFLNIYDAAGPMTALEFQQRTDNLQSDLKTARIVEREYPLNGGLWSGQHGLSPRISFAWDPSNDGKMSVRGGWGRFYERMSNQLWDSEYTNLPSFAVTSATIFDPVKPVFGLGQSQTMPYNYPRPAGLTAGLNPQGGLLNGRAKADLLDPDIGIQHLDNWFFGAQRELGHNMLVEFDYIGSLGRNMYLRYNVNRFNGDLLDGRFDGIIPGVAALNFGQSIDKSHYNGITGAFRVNRADVQFGAAYTVGKAVDMSSTLTPPDRPDAFGPQSQDEGPSDFDARHKLSISANWRIPGPADGAAKAIAGGWQLAGVMIAQSGLPFTVVCGGASFTPIRDAAGNIIGNSGCDYNADGTGNDRPNTPTFGSSLSGLSNEDFLNGIFKASDFPTPTPGVQGNLGRNTYRGPRYFNVDLSMIKTVRVGWFNGSGADVQFRFEMFNALNTLNLNPPVNALKDPLFGKSTSALPGRILQFSGRLIF